MKKSKFILTLALLSSLALSGCNPAENTVTNDPTATPSATDIIKPVAKKDDTLSITGPKEMEVGQTKNIMALAKKSQNNRLIHFTVEPGSEKLVKIEEKSIEDGAWRGTVTGLAVGTATVRATSVETGDYNLFTIDVSAKKDTLTEALLKLTKLNNYTFISKPTDEKKVTKDNTHILKRIEEGYTLLTASGKGIAETQVRDDTDEDKTGAARVYGVGIDAKDKDDENYGTAVLLDKFIRRKDKKLVENTAYTMHAFRDSYSNEYLDETDFAGIGVHAQAASNNPIATLANINPNWQNIEKNDENTYEIVGDSTHMDLANLEVEIWKLVDPTGMQDVMQTKQSSTNNNSFSFYDIATWIDTTIKVTEDNVIFSIAPANGTKYIPDGSTTAVDYIGYTGSVSDINQTTLDPEFANYITLSNDKGTNQLTAKKEELVSDVKAMKEAFEGNNYVYAEDYNFSYKDNDTDPEPKDHPVTLYVYLTPNYIFMNYTEEFNEGYKKAYGYYPTRNHTYLPPIVIYKHKSGKLHQAELINNGTAIKAAGDTPVTIGQGQAAQELSNDYFYQMAAAQGYGYLAEGTFGLNDGFANLSDTATSLFSGGDIPALYYTTGYKTAAYLLLDEFFGGGINYDQQYINSSTGAFDPYGIATSASVTSYKRDKDDNIIRDAQGNPIEEQIPILNYIFGMRPTYNDAGTAVDSIYTLGFLAVTEAGMGYVIRKNFTDFGKATNNSINDNKQFQENLLSEETTPDTGSETGK